MTAHGTGNGETHHAVDYFQHNFFLPGKYFVAEKPVGAGTHQQPVLNGGLKKKNNPYFFATALEYIRNIWG